jgi:DNA-binding transcriptional MocR family regulator
VGRGTFVRERAALRRPEAASGGTAWQIYVLPGERETPPGRILGDVMRHAERDDVIPLSLGYPKTAMLPVEELSATTAAVLGSASFQYSNVEGLPELRSELARLGRARGLDDDSDSIVVTNGARQATVLAARAVLRSGDIVACESPTFMGTLETLRGTGANVLPVPTGPAGLDIDALEKLLAHYEIRLLALQPRLNNPTGGDLSPQGRERLIELARRHSFFVLEDAVYADLRLEGPDPGPLRALDPDHVIYVDSLSKTVAPGLRAGWVAASGPVLDRIVAEKRGDDGHSPTLVQQLIARFFAEGHYERQLERTLDVHRRGRNAVLRAFDRHLSPLATTTRPPGGGHVWVTLNEQLDERLLYEAALEAGVTFIPGSAMLVERPRATQLRLSFSFLEPPQLEEGVRRLAGVVGELAGGEHRRRALPLA